MPHPQNNGSQKSPKLKRQHFILIQFQKSHSRGMATMGPNPKEVTEK